MDIPELPFVIVEWDDAHADFESITVQDAGLRHEPAVMLTAGWLLLDNEKGVSVANEVCPDDSTYRGRSFILRSMIRNVTPFKLSKPRKRAAP